MADRVFSIDFGSSYTKVALRRDPGADSELLGLTGVATVADADFCIPSTIAVDRRGRRPRVECGEQVFNLKPDQGIEVVSNWKKWLFQSPAVTESTPNVSPLEALLQSEEFLALAARYGVAAGQVGHLENLVRAARGMVGRSVGSGASTESQQQAYAAVLAQHYFHWLRDVVLRACDRLPSAGLKFDEIPVRIAVPAFAGADHPGTQSLVAGLRKAGWTIHPERPVVTEPYANAVGILTRGANVAYKGRIRFRDMFARGPFITVLKDGATYKSYRVLVVDIGAYTTDFAALTLDTQGETITDPDQALSLVQDSLPIGVSNLDADLLAAVSPDKAAALKSLSAREWETLHRSVYSDGKAYKKPGGLTVGGPADDGTRSVVTGFAEQVATLVEKFCKSTAPAGRQELILTGGGCLIPTVREAVLRAARAGGHEYVKTHAPAIKKQTTNTPAHKLDDHFTRGGSALGGASIYFDREFY